jgi:hypothetical protein
MLFAGVVADGMRVLEAAIPSYISTKHPVISRRLNPVIRQSRPRCLQAVNVVALLLDERPFGWVCFLLQIRSTSQAQNCTQQTSFPGPQTSALLRRIPSKAIRPWANDRPYSGRIFKSLSPQTEPPSDALLISAQHRIRAYRHANTHSIWHLPGHTA